MMAGIWFLQFHRLFSATEEISQCPKNESLCVPTYQNAHLFHFHFFEQLGKYAQAFFQGFQVKIICCLEQ